ncbi:MAG: hypothetical protein B6244_00925 [Candidatus Cloacimonetes bacterium 4572_55]|nr:MAG: hypothetical protein B6244_00925 [Candidatus Cloacimonetes bacterium 4572_55]
MKNILAATLLLSIWIAHAHAFNPNRFVPYQGESDPYFVENDPELRSQLRFCFQFIQSKESFDSDGSTVSYRQEEEHRYSLLTFDARYQVHPHVEIRAIPSFLSQQVENSLTTWTGQNIGDTWASVKYSRVDSAIRWGGNMGVKFPTGDSSPNNDDLPTGTGQTDYNFSGFLSYPFEIANLSGGLGYRLRGENGETKRQPGNEFHYYLKAERSLSKNVSMSLMSTGFSGGEGQYDGEELSHSSESIHSLVPDLVIKIDTLHLSLSTKIDIGGKNYPKSSRLQCSLTYLL